MDVQREKTVHEWKPFTKQRQILHTQKILINIGKVKKGQPNTVNLKR